MTLIVSLDTVLLHSDTVLRRLKVEYIKPLFFKQCVIRKANRKRIKRSGSYDISQKKGG